MNFFEPEAVEASQAVILLVAGVGFLAVFWLLVATIGKPKNSGDSDDS